MSFCWTRVKTSRFPPVIASGFVTLITTESNSGGTTFTVPAPTFPLGPARTARAATSRFWQVIFGGAMTATGRKTADRVSKPMPLPVRATVPLGR